MTTPEIQADSDAAAANAARVLQFFSAVLGPAHDTTALGGYLSPDFVDHDAATGDSGASGVAAKLSGLWSILPDGVYVPLHVVAAGDLVTVRSRLEAPAVAAFPAISLDFSDTYRIVSGLITEHWHVTDGLALAQALSDRAISA